jgi:hypothetical protein
MTRMLLLVGDVICDTTIEPRAIKSVLDEIAEGEEYLAVGNVEIPICDLDYGQRNEFKLMEWRADEGAAVLLRDSAFSATCFANNHTTSWSRSGAMRTMDVLRHAGLGVFGAGTDIASACAPWVDESRGVAFIGLTCAYMPHSAAERGVPGANAVHISTSLITDTDKMSEYPGDGLHIEFELARWSIQPTLEAVSAARRSGYDVLVYAHWGRLFSYEIQSYQLRIAELLAEAGANLVVGCHSHTVGPFASYRGVPVAFSLGNFIWSRSLLTTVRSARSRAGVKARQWSRIGLVARVRLDQRPWNAELVPVAMNPDSGLPMVARLDERRWVAGWIHWLSEYEIPHDDGWHSEDPGDGAEWFPLGYRPGSGPAAESGGPARPESNANA